MSDAVAYWREKGLNADQFVSGLVEPARKAGACNDLASAISGIAKPTLDELGQDGCVLKSPNAYDNNLLQAVLAGCRHLKEKRAFSPLCTLQLAIGDDLRGGISKLDLFSREGRQSASKETRQTWLEEAVLAIERGLPLLHRLRQNLDPDVFGYNSDEKDVDYKLCTEVARLQLKVLDLLPDSENTLFSGSADERMSVMQDLISMSVSVERCSMVPNLANKCWKLVLDIGKLFENLRIEDQIVHGQSSTWLQDACLGALKDVAELQPGHFEQLLQEVCSQGMQQADLEKLLLDFCVYAEDCSSRSGGSSHVPWIQLQHRALSRIESHKIRVCVHLSSSRFVDAYKAALQAPSTECAELMVLVQHNAATHDELRATEDSFYSAGLVAVMCKSFLCAFEYSAPESSVVNPSQSQ